MPAGRDDVIGAIRGAQEEAERLALAVPDEAWSKGVHEQGWNAKQLLCHVASTAGIASFLLDMAKAPGSGGMGAGGFDIDSWNAEQVALREGKSLDEILDELRENCQKGMADVKGAGDELLSRQFRAPWGIEGPLADVIVGSIEGHFMVHVRDLEKAVG
jgi:hypothetical protein